MMSNGRKPNFGNTIKRKAKSKGRRMFNRLSIKAKMISVILIIIVIGLGLGADKIGLIQIPDEYRIFTSANTEYNKEAESKDIQALIDSVEVSDPKYTEYNRDDWERPAKKFEGESIRNYAASISPDNISKTNKDFQYNDPFTGDVISELTIIDYDHIIPLSYVNGQVGGEWSSEKKHEYTFDLEVGVNTHQSENRTKGAKGPSGFMPEINQEEYAYTWLVIADKYDIPIRPEDMNVIKRTLNKTKDVNVINIYN